MEDQQEETVKPVGTPISWDKRFDLSKELFLATLSRQFEYGKWVLASLLAVHAGSLIAIAQAGDKRVALFQSCGSLLIYGPSCALVAGGFAWVNFTIASNVYGNRMVSLRKGEEPEDAGWKVVAVPLTMYLSVGAALGSLVYFLVAAARAANVLK